ncbi:MAG TPA: ABC transporter substrate-binding protein, partial [Gemmatirosa sp.]
AIGVAPTIAVLRPESGEDPVLRGAAIAVRDLNAQGARVPGPRFEVRVPPTRAEGAVAIAAALRADRDVVGVIGPTDSQSALDAAPVYGDVDHDGANGVVAISPTASSPVLHARSPWFFRVCPDDRAASRAAARFALDSLHVARAAVVYRNDVYGKGWSRGFADAFTAAGGTVVMRAPEVARLTEWAEPYATYARHERADLLVVVGDASGDALPLVRAARAAGLDVPMLGGDGLSDTRDPALRREIGAVRYTALFDARHPASAQARHFVDAYVAVYGTRPGQEAALAYDAALLLGEAARATGADRHAVREYLDGVGRSRPAFVGATGAIAFDRGHDVVFKPITLARVADQ